MDKALRGEGTQDGSSLRHVASAESWARLSKMALLTSDVAYQLGADWACLFPHFSPGSSPGLQESKKHKLPLPKAQAPPTSTASLPLHSADQNKSQASPD